MRAHKKSLILLVLLLLITVSLLYIGLTYSKYTADVSGEGATTVAQWSFEDDNDSMTMDISFDESYHASTLVANKIAPGTSGAFSIALNNANSEVGVDFTLEFGNASNIPQNLVFYRDSSFTTELDITQDTITGQLAAEDAVGVTVNIYWKWEYETLNGDDEDTADGLAAATLSIPVTITGVQVAPSTTAITSHVNAN